MKIGYITYFVISRGICLPAFFMLTILTTQAQVGKVGINTTTPAAILHVKDSSVLFSGVNPLPMVPGPPPVSGTGTRMMWYPDKAAFRSGLVSNPFWDKDSIGDYSAAIGYNTSAKGLSSVALGFYSNARGDYALASGLGAIATGMYSTSIGQYCLASGVNATAFGRETRAQGFLSIANGYKCIANNDYAMAFGSETIASGQYSFSIGYTTRAKATASIAMGSLSTSGSLLCLTMGQLNDTTNMTSLTNWVPTDPIFVIGNGTANNARSNAFTVLKNGMTGINTVTPDAMIHIIRGSESGGPFNSNAAAIFEGGQGSFIQLSNNDDIQSGILSGNEVTSLRSALIFSPDSSVQIRSGGNNTRFVVRNDGKTGIGDLSPNARLHISEGSGGLIYHNEADMILEDNSSTYLQLSSLTSGESGILSGNQVTALRSGLIFLADSSVQLIAGGNTKFTLKQNGNIGIGTTNPQKLLHLRKNSSGATPTTSAIAVVEGNTDVSLNLLTPDAESSAIYFGNPSNAVHGGIVYNSPSLNGLAFRTNGNVTRAVISDAGDVGIGDNTPDAKLDVNGTVILGTNGTSITEIIKVTVLSDVPNVVAGGTVTETIPVANSNTTSSVSISPASALQNGLIMAYARVSVAGTVEVKFTNTTGADINPPPMNFYITVIR